MYIYATTTTRVAWIKTFGTWTPLRLPKPPQEAPSSAFRGAHYLHYSPSQTAMLSNNKLNKISSYVSLFLTLRHENCSKLCLLPAVLGNAGSKQEITVIVLTLSRSEPLPPLLLKSPTLLQIFGSTVTDQMQTHNLPEVKIENQTKINKLPPPPHHHHLPHHQHGDH